MFPLRDHNPSRGTPFVTWALIAANVLIFLAYWPAYGWNEEAIRAFFDRWALIPQEVLSGQDRHTLLTSMFLHGGWMHLIGNMVFLWIFGDNMEDALGHLGFLLFYIASGLAAAGLQIAANPASTTPMVGASGAIAGVLGGYLLLYPRAAVDVAVFFGFFVQIVTVPAWWMLGLWFVFQFLGGFMTPTEGGGVAYWAHAGGFMAGFALTIPVWLARGATGYWRRTHGHPPHAPTQLTRVPIVRRRRR